jgi:dTMP kinase
VPDLTILFDLPVEVGLARANGRIEELTQADQPPESRFEQEKLDFHQRVKDGYLELARIDDHRYEIIDATKPVDEVTQDIMAVLEKRLDAWKGAK